MDCICRQGRTAKIARPSQTTLRLQQHRQQPAKQTAPERPLRGGFLLQAWIAGAQFSFRFDTGASNWAISAVCGALPLKVSTLPSEEIATLSPSLTSPARIISASGSWT